ncbi:MAG: hypothetical protein WB973_15145 [Thermoanaerobaculia bacterium]
MNDQEFAEAFERCEIANDAFHHRDHVRLAWTYLRRMSLIDALVRFTESLKRFANHHGHPELYHETITWAYLLLIHERMERNPVGDFAAFEAANADLFTWKPSILNHYYDQETLDSPLAKRSFLMPTR